jgi:diaminohydroxyphosphoribosylaminopyrimidine deaminase/5-amino-6-(5-phosphoribosylamino)uracil reductase
VLDAMAEREVRHLLVEGGPTLAAAFLRAGLVDEVHAYLAPVLLGAGPAAVGDLGVGSIAEALRLTTTSVEQVGPDVLIVARSDRPDPAARTEASPDPGASAMPRPDPAPPTLTSPDPGAATPSSPTREET